MRRFLAWLTAVGVCASVLATANADSMYSETAGQVDIRRTVDAIPHLRANNWHDLGFGIGFVQAEDALCTLAEAFVTYEGRRSWFFGAEGRPARNSTLGKPLNIELDFFFRTFADADIVAQYRASNPPELQALVAGFAAGYNRYLGAKGGAGAGNGHACRAAPWLRPITEDDVYRRLYAVQIAAGYGRFIPEIVNAAPLQKKNGRMDASLNARLSHPIGERSGVGSNAFAFGQEATGEKGGVLFGNPHWFWGGPDRFYQMHLTIPGQLDVAGVSFLGVPLIMIGFNRDVAWSHTVSTSRRFGLFDLALRENNATELLVDGVGEAMRKRVVSVETRAADGGTQSVTRTLYRTRYGPVIDFSSRHAAFGWNADHTLAIRDVNAENFRVFRNFLRWNQARSLEHFIDIQRQEAAVPWVNTLAIGRGDGRVWYGDIGAIPNVPDSQRERCKTPLATQFEAVDAAIPVLDGSRSDCNWRIDPAARQAGAMPVAGMPGLLRTDYVANMNDSYWLANVHEPLEGFSSVLGGEREPLSLRGQLGHRMALDLLAEGRRAKQARSFSELLMHAVLVSRAGSADRYKKALLAQACKNAGVPQAADLATACAILRRWPNTAEAGDRGALLWESFWAELQAGSNEPLQYRVGFSPAAPLTTPDMPAVKDEQAVRALTAAIAIFAKRQWPLDMAVGDRRHVAAGGHRERLYGGCDDFGYFVVACSRSDDDALNADTVANSYLQVVRFGAAGVEAHTLLAHGQQEAALETGEGWTPIFRYAHKQWLRFPFSDDEVDKATRQRYSLRSH